MGAAVFISRTCDLFADNIYLGLLLTGVAVFRKHPSPNMREQLPSLPFPPISLLSTAHIERLCFFHVLSSPFLEYEFLLAGMSHVYKRV